MSAQSHNGARRRASIWTSIGWRRLAALTVLLGALETPVIAWSPAAYGASVTAASFTGGAGTVTVGNTVYAKQGGQLTLTVTTSSDTQCVEVTGAFTGHQQSDSAKSSWSLAVHRAHPDARGGGDVVERRIEPAVGEDLGRGGQDPLAVALGVGSQRACHVHGG